MSKRPVVSVVTVVNATQKRTIDVTGALLLSLLRATGLSIPNGARVYFTVPGGADWSNTAVDVEEEHPVRVTWSVETSSVESSEEKI